MKHVLLCIIFFSVSFLSIAQTGTLEGKITDGKTSTPISSVTIEVVGEKISKASNIDGQFSLTLESGKKYSLQITAVGYQTKVVDEVTVEAGKSTSLEINLDRSTKAESEVVVRSSARKESTAALIAVQKNTSVVAQVISAEAIRRSPDKNTGEVLKRVPGLSLQEGRYIIVRGLADRYNQAMLNGVLLSSTEPDRKTFSFDIFPSGMIENIIINKTFIPELPGEWAGGLIQVNTKDVPSKSFFTVQIGTGFNTATLGKDFYSYKGSNTDWLGFDNGARSMPAGIPNKAAFNDLSRADKTAYGKMFSSVWSADKTNVQPDKILQFSGGFNKNLGGNKKLSAIFALNYRGSDRRNEYRNQINTVLDNGVASLSNDYYNNKYSRDVLAGALANITFQLGSNNKISFKNLLNVSTSDYATLRTGKDYSTNPDPGDNIRATELAFKANTFFNTQVTGDHNINKYKAKFHWFGSFNILDQYVPDQRRIQYNQDDPTNPSSPYSLLDVVSTSQKSGSRYFGSLSDYIYTAGGDLSHTFNLGKLNQTIKGGYFFQVKDRLFDARPFTIYLPNTNSTLLHLPQDQVYNPENYGNGADNKFAFTQLYNPNFRYLANSILNAGFLQLDNQIAEKLRVVWGLRVEDFDQVVGSMVKSDPRFVNTKKTDYLPGVNFTYKVTPKTNIRLSGSQTVIRPEFRELSNFQFYDFDLSATIAGNPKLVRTKVSNLDLRYEIYPRSGELITAGVFYKYFKDPIEAIANQASFNFINADKATSYGAELEFRKKMDFYTPLKNLTLQGNFSYIYNRVHAEGRNLDRPMQGQSPYLLNATAQYDMDKIGLTTTVLFNRIGRRILLVGGSDQPPVWENPRSVVDFQVAKKVVKNKGELRLNVSDLLNQTAIFYYKEKNEKYQNNDPFFIKRKYGSTITMSFNYNF
jgi:outer membrane receptor for ferrienterochelin and colicin